MPLITFPDSAGYFDPGGKGELPREINPVTPALRKKKLEPKYSFTTGSQFDEDKIGSARNFEKSKVHEKGTCIVIYNILFLVWSSVLVLLPC